MADRRSVEAAYPLSPMQLGMLFATASAPGSGVYVEQTTCRLCGDLSIPAFRRAWERVVQRHQTLRTAFAWKRLSNAVQAVYREVTVTFACEDWREFSQAERKDKLEALLFNERAAGFELTKPPLMRLCVIRTDEAEYEFVWTYHHLLLDGWSVPLLLTEVMAFYDGIRNNDEVQLPEPRPYRDYVAWIKQQDKKTAEAYWHEVLRGFSVPTRIAIEPPSERLEQRYSTRETALSAETTACLTALGRRHGFTLSTAVQGAWAALLSRYSGQHDVVFGTTVSGRPADLPGAEGMVGLFINTLPTRVIIGPDDRVTDWLRNLQGHALDARQYEYSSLLDIQGWTDVPRGTPLFDSIVVFENFPLDVSAWENRSDLRIYDIRSAEQTEYPVTLVSAPRTCLPLTIVFDESRGDAAAIDRLLIHLKTLLEGIASNSNTRVRELPLMSPDERQKITVEWNRTEAACSLPPVHEWFEQQAARTPNSTALRWTSEEVSYSDLNRRANRLARYLRRSGIGPESVVGVCLERTPSLIVALLAVLKSGAAYVPLDPSYPPVRLDYMLTDSGADLLLTGDREWEQLGLHTRPVLSLDREAEAIAAEPSENLAVPVLPLNLAYVMYTSGSTGVPKGTMIQHLGLSNYLGWCEKAYPLRAGKGSVLHSSIAFDLTVTSLFAPLVVGGAVELLPEEPGVTELAKALRSGRGYSLVKITPAHLDLLRQELDGFDLTGSTQAFVIGGEQLLGKQLEWWQQNAPCAVLINEYGPTETVVGCCVFQAEPGQRFRAAVPIGRPIQNTRLYILDTELLPLPCGVVGELFIGGLGVACGYLNRPELTADKFVPDPFSNTPGERLYRTGDLCRWRPDGDIEFIGRADDQVKVRGYRVELSEVESAIKQHERVSDCVVLVRGETGHDTFLAAYVVPNGPKPTIGEMRSFLMERLPEYMVPSAFDFISSLPLTLNGKVDRSCLPDPSQAGECCVEYVAPRNHVAQALAEIWQQVLGVRRVDQKDSFFDLGGHSLRAMQLGWRVRDTLGVEIPLRCIFEHPRFAEMAAEIETRMRGAAALVPTFLPRRERQEVLKLSSAQERLWFLEQLAPGSALYNQNTAVRLSGALDVATMQRALDEVVRRHETLRSRFIERNGVPAAVVESEVAVRMDVIDLSHGPTPATEEMALAQAAESARRPFELTCAPLLRCCIWRLADDDHLALLTLHHIISDGWSVSVLLREVSALYAAFSKSETSPLGELNVQYGDWAEWQRGQIDAQTLKSQLAYWQRTLGEDAQWLQLPSDRPRPTMQTFRGAHHRFTWGRDVLNSLHELARQQSVTIFMVLSAGLKTVLSRYSGQKQISIGTPIANRRSEVEGLIGLFVNTLVLRTDLNGDPTFVELLAREREAALGAYANQDVPFDLIVSAVAPDRDLSHTPLFQVMLVLNNTPQFKMDLPGLTLRAEPLEDGIARFDLTLELSETDEGIWGSAEYNTDLFDQQIVSRLLDAMKTLLLAACETPTDRLSKLAVISGAELRLVLADWNRTGADYPTELCAHELFEQQAADHPAEVALTLADQRLTYAELNARSNQLARYLRALGVGPDVLVGLATERSIEMVVGLLGVMKAGGAYVPLDPGYPKERLAYMIADTGLNVLLTQSKLLARLPEHRAHTVCLDRLPDEVVRESSENPDIHVAPTNLAYVIYTSGSTGRPKGTMLQHSGLVNLALAQRKEFAIKKGKRVLQFASLSFDASVWETFMALANGGALCVAKDVSSLDILPSILRDSHITTVTLPPSVLNVLAECELPELETIIAAGEPCTEALVRRWGPGRAFFNAYGPTETTVCASMARCPEEQSGSPSIGAPIANTRLYVLDEYLNPVPVGVAGELYVGGAGIARGYLGRPDLTAERFLPEAFSGTPGARLYRTGDLCRWRRDGNIDFIGRIDQQVKIRGYRIELGEIESVLAQHSAVQECAVVADRPGEKRVIAYVIPRSPEIRQEQLRTWLSERLPEFMLPSVFVHLERFPRLPNGKLDRAGLPAPDRLTFIDAPVYRAPSTETEIKLAALWEELLQIERVGANDNFFELGGHSLLVTQLRSRLRQAFQIDLPLRALFELPTLSAQAHRIEHAIREVGHNGEIMAVLMDVQQLADEDVLKALRSEKNVMKAAAHD